MGRWLPTFTIAAVTLAATAASAQEAPGRSDTTGPLYDLGQTLDAHGIRIRAQLINEMAENPVGGVKQGNDDAGQLQFGASFDLKKLVHLPGATFHFTFVRSYGQPTNKEYTGDFVKTQEVYKNPYHRLKLGIFAYEQKAFDNKLDVLVGRLGTTALYGRLSNACYFESGLTCGVPQLLNSETGWSFPTSATWAGNVKYHFTDRVTLQAGAFEVDPFVQHTNGFYWSTSHATGVSVPVELQVGDYDLTKHKYPWDFKLGGYVSTAPVTDLFYNTKGQSLGLHGGAARVSPVLRSGFYAMGEKAVWRSKDDPNKSLALFGGYEQALDPAEIARMQLYTGAVLRGMVPSRPHDIISATVSYLDITPAELDYLRDARIKAGGTGMNKPNQFGFEVDYSWLLFNSARVAPNVQYIVNPDNSQLPNTKVLPKDVLTLGVKVTFNFAGWLGLPIAPNLSD